MKRFVVKRRENFMPTIAINKPKKDYDVQMREFNDFLKRNIEFIKRVTPTNPTISKDDEWNDPIYDDYLNSDNNGDD